MRAESLAELSHDNLHKNGILQFRKYTSYEHFLCIVGFMVE